MMKVGIYNRCSTEEETQANALEIQALESLEIAKEKGWNVVRHYVESQSGTTSYKRSEYQKMLTDMEQDIFDIVMIKSIDRLTRSAKDWYLFLDKLTRCQKQLYLYIDHKFYTTEDNLLTGIKAILAEDFSRELSKKIKNAHRRRQEKRSGFNITVPMFGWDKIGQDTYALNEQEAEAYRCAFIMAEEGNGFYTIANQMYEKGIRSKRGERISAVQWRNMLYSPRAHGTIVLHTKEYDFETKKKKPVPEKDWIVIEHAIPAIVNREYQERVLQKLQERVGVNSCQNLVKNKKGKHKLSGKVFCLQCGKPYYRRAMSLKNEKKGVWICSTALKEGKHKCHCKNICEADILKAIRESCKDYYENCWKQEKQIRDNLRRFFQKTLEEDRSQRVLKRYEKELSKVKKKKHQLFEKMLNGIIEESDFVLWNKKIEEEIEILYIEIDRMKKNKKEYINLNERIREIEQKVIDEIYELAIMKLLICQIEKIIVSADGNLQISFYEYL